MRIKISKAGVLTVTNYASTTLLTGPTLALNTWYVLEWQHNLSTGAGQFWVDGVSYGTYTADVATAGTPLIILYCPTGASGGHLMWFDDWAINDDQGTSQNGRIGNQGKIVLLKPISDNARTGFTDGAGGTTSLFSALDNAPPVGVVLASAVAASQIKDATSNTTDNYVANLAAYSTAVASGGGGIAAADQITLVQGVVQHGNSSASSRTNGLTVVANPAIAEATGTTGTTAAGAMPTGWTTLKSAVTYAPSVTKGTSPTVKFRKGTASTDSSMADFLGLYVEYIPVLPQPLTTVAQATAGATVMVAAAPRLAPSAQVATTASVVVATPVPLAATAGVQAQATARVSAGVALAPAAVATTQAIAVLTAARQLAPVAATATQAVVTVSAPTLPLLAPSANAQSQAIATVTAGSRIVPVAGAQAQANMNVAAAVTLSPAAAALTQAAVVVAATPKLAPSAGAATQAVALVTAAAVLAPAAAARTQVAAAVAAAAMLSPSAVAQATAFALVSASAPPLFPVVAGAQTQATAMVVAQALIVPMSAQTSAGQALVTVAVQISVEPVQASSGAEALVTVATQIQIDPVVAVTGAEADLMVKVRTMLRSIQAATDGGNVSVNVTAPVLLSSM